MTTRTSTRNVTFRQPFTLDGHEQPLPAGSYEIETDEELLEGPSFPVWRRRSVYLRLPADPARPGVTRTLTVNPNDLDEALDRDHAN